MQCRIKQGERWRQVRGKDRHEVRPSTREVGGRENGGPQAETCQSSMRKLERRSWEMGGKDGGIGNQK